MLEVWCEEDCGKDESVLFLGLRHFPPKDFVFQLTPQSKDEISQDYSSYAFRPPSPVQICCCHVHLATCVHSVC